MSDRFKIGFTGTQEGMTNKQQDNLLEIFSWFYRAYPQGVEAHQGQCIGSDEQFTCLMKSQGIWVVSHPPVDKSKTHSIICDETRPEKSFLDRNRDIVDEVNVLLAAPRSRKEELRSGTWATVRYARKTNKPYEMVWPN